MSTDPVTPSAPAPRRPWLPIVLVLGALVVGAGIWFVSTANRLVALQESVNTAWAQVETVRRRGMPGSAQIALIVSPSVTRARIWCFRSPG